MDADTQARSTRRRGRSYIPDGYLTEQDVTDALTDAALRCGLGDREIARTIRSVLPPV